MKKDMIKRLAALAVLGIMVFGMGTVVMAQPQGFGGGRCAGIGANNGLRLNGNGLMWAEDGTFLSRAAFEARLDALIAQGLISATDREALLSQYDWCVANGGGAIGARCVAEPRGNFNVRGANLRGTGLNCRWQ